MPDADALFVATSQGLRFLHTDENIRSKSDMLVSRAVPFENVLKTVQARCCSFDFLSSSKSASIVAGYMSGQTASYTIPLHLRSSDLPIRKKNPPGHGQILSKIICAHQKVHLWPKENCIDCKDDPPGKPVAYDHSDLDNHVRCVRFNHNLVKLKLVASGTGNGIVRIQLAN